MSELEKIRLKAELILKIKEGVIFKFLNYDDEYIYAVMLKGKMYELKLSYRDINQLFTLDSLEIVDLEELKQNATEEC